MKIFLIWADRYENIETLYTALQKEHDILYWVGLGDGQNFVGKNTVFHDHFAAWAGQSAESLATKNFPPPDRDLIEKMYKTESIIMSMMNKKFDTVCVDQRRNIFYGMLGYWHGVLKKYKPDIIIFPATPHTVYNYVIYALAKMMNIRTVMFDDPWIGNNLLMYRDWMEGSTELKQQLSAIKGRDFNVTDLAPSVREYYEQYFQKDKAPVYMDYYNETYAGVINASLRKIRIVGASILDGTIFKKGVRFAVKQFRPNLKKEYESVQTTVDLSEMYVYVALGFQPEMVSSPMGDMYVDQILMIETLAAALPEGWLLYVKEHPGQWLLRCGINYSSSRYQGYYKRVSRIKSVRIVPIHTDTFSLTKNAQAVAVVTGSPGWEAILHSKPALVFGRPWYRDCEGVFQVDGVVAAGKAFEKIENGYIVNEDETIRFLKALGDVSIKGILESVPTRKLAVNREQSMQNIAEAILSEIRCPQ